MKKKKEKNTRKRDRGRKTKAEKMGVCVPKMRGKINNSW
jgi:hypothetical protein